MNGSVVRIDLDIIASIVTAGARVLDLGCGDGDLLLKLAREKAVIGRGIELSEVGVRRCVAKGLSVRQGDIDVGLSDYPSASFDYVILSQTLPYVDDPKTLLQEMLRVGRRAIVSFPNLGYWRARLQLLVKGSLPEMVFSSCPWYDSPRVRPISIDGFLAVCAEAQISIIDSIYLNGTGQLRGVRKASLWSTTGLFVLECHGASRCSENRFRAGDGKE